MGKRAFLILSDEMIHEVDSLRQLAGVGTLDLLEVCAPWDAPLTQTVREFGGKAMSIIGVHNGYDLTTLKGFRAVDPNIFKLALLVIPGLPLRPVTRGILRKCIDFRNDVRSVRSY